eukprot:TRINITY_DN12813_c0_g1_i3.p2 TRINITY_DN12813_c0_g1~~TRINITY_DN12813_c0_g1_i3.p2  ORF type:complete len:149 (-),score=56.61 TRINITY_DN12813_c0_g1_i3:118-564(-)
MGIAATLMEENEDAPIEVRMNDAKEAMQAEVARENEAKRKGKGSRKRRNLMSQLSRKVPSQVIEKMAEEESHNAEALQKKLEKAEVEKKKKSIKGRRVYKKNNKFYMALKEGANEREEAVGEIKSFLKDHFYGNRLKRENLSFMICKK